ncbi:MAG: sugar ABC transporter permease [Actinomycetota bacterium]|nr:sugar ABC transporter permease [Actinomycetota bacterium]
MSSTTTTPPGAIVGPQTPRSRVSGFLGGGAWQWLAFTAPAIVLLLVFLVYPTIWTIVLSFYEGRGRNLFREFVGFENYTRLFTEDRRFLDLSEFPPSGAIWNNLLWAVLYTGLCLLFGLVIAVLAARVRYESIVKAVIFIPMAIAATAVALIWKFVYSPNPDLGVINAVLNGIGFSPIPFLGRESTVNYALIFANVWASAGFAMVVLSAALKGISQEVIEAARTDGASEWDIFRRIQLPLLSLPISVVTVWLLINVIKLFDLIYIATAGGPNGQSRVIGYFMFTETFEGGRYGYGSAIAVVMLLLIIPIMAFNIKRFRSEAVQG